MSNRYRRIVMALLGLISVGFLFGSFVFLKRPGLIHYYRHRLRVNRSDTHSAQRLIQLKAVDAIPELLSYNSLNGVQWIHDAIPDLVRQAQADAIPTLRKVIRSADCRARYIAARAVADLTVNATQELIDDVCLTILASDCDELLLTRMSQGGEVRCAAIHAVTATEAFSSEVTVALTEALFRIERYDHKYANRRVFSCLCLALCKRKGYAILETYRNRAQYNTDLIHNIRDALGDPHSDLRYCTMMIVESLGLVHIPALEDQLKALLSDTDHRIQEKAVDLMMKTIDKAEK